MKGEEGGKDGDDDDDGEDNSFSTRSWKLTLSFSLLFCFVLFCFVLFCLFVCLFVLLLVLKKKKKKKKKKKIPEVPKVTFFPHPPPFFLPLPPSHLIKVSNI